MSIRVLRICVFDKNEYAAEHRLHGALKDLEYAELIAIAGETASLTDRLVSIQAALGISLSGLASWPRDGVVVRPIFRSRDLAVDPAHCFVLMPFDTTFQPIYDDHIKKAIRDAGLVSRRADDFFNAGSVVEDIWSGVAKAAIVIADLTGKNPNVFYEVGMAHTLGKRVVLLTQSMDDVPFDLRHLRHIQYTFTPRGMTALENALRKTLLSLMDGLDLSGNPKHLESPGVDI